MENVLEASGLSKSFGGFQAVRNVDFRLKRGAVHAVIGPNGAGKTTLFRLLTKFLAPTSGRIRHDGADVTAFTPAAMAKRGVVSSFQISAVFAALTVRENIEIALLHEAGLAWSMVGRIGRSRRVKERANELLERFDLWPHADTAAGRLPYGLKRSLELATTLALEPKVLLLDEPIAGLSHQDIDRVTDLIRAASRGRTVLLVEHNMKAIAALAERITVMVRGEILAEGSYAEVSARPDVMAAYTGGGHG